MTRPLRLQVFVSSPGDMKAERDTCRALIDELQRDKLRAKAYDIDTYFWEDDALPDIAEDAQAVVNQTLFEARREPIDFRIVICLLWTRMGTPTRFALSGTAEEVLRCLLDPGVDRSHVLMYASDLPLPPSRIDTGQLDRVRCFVDGFRAAGGLSWPLTPGEPFEPLLRRQLRDTVDACGAAWARGHGTPAAASGAIPLTDNLKDYVRQLLLELDRLAALAQENERQLLALLSACATPSFGGPAAGLEGAPAQVARRLETFLADIEHRFRYTPLPGATATLEAAKVLIAFGRVLGDELRPSHAELSDATRRLLARLKPVVELVLMIPGSVIVNWPALVAIPDGSLLARIRADGDAMRALESTTQALAQTLQRSPEAVPALKPPFPPRPAPAS